MITLYFIDNIGMLYRILLLMNKLDLAQRTNLSKHLDLLTLGKMRKKITILKMTMMTAIMMIMMDLTMSLTQLIIINCWQINLTI
jgi:hypothetical protein